MEYFTPENIVNFEEEETLCFGVNEKWGKYQVPVQVSNQNKQLVETLTKSLSTRSSIRGERTLYLKIEGLTLKQRMDLLGRGKCYVNIKFSCIGVYTNQTDDHHRYLVFKLTKLAKCDKEVQLETAED